MPPTMAPACHRTDRGTRRPFVVTPYVPTPDGTLKPQMPDRGPCSDGDEPCCKLAIHHYRDRTTGPCFPLAVVRCKVHAVAFTLYPPGHVPYGRAAVAPVGPEGNPVRNDTAPVAEAGPAGQQHGEAPAGVQAFDGTVFDAALDAAQGRLWQRDYLLGGTSQWWASQGRRLQQALRLFGLLPQQSDDLRHELAGVLGVDALLLCEQARQVQALPGYRKRGQAVCLVLASLAVNRTLAGRLYACGHLCGLWGQAHLWHVHSRTLRKLPFRPTDTRAPP